MIDTPPLAVLVAFAAALGSVIGSFLNVCIYRLPIGKSIVWPASACTNCGHQLSWYENVPIVSWMALRARCRSCGEPIAMRYPIVEALTGAMFAAACWYYGPGLLFVSHVVFGCALLVLFAIDLEHHLLPDAITLPGIVVGFVFSLFVFNPGPPPRMDPGWKDSLIGILVGGGVLWAIAEAYYRIRKEDGMGGGDIKMLAMIGAFLGWKLTLMALVMASFSGTIVGIALLISGRGTMKYALPFGTFLALGAAAAATVGQPFLDWYVSLW